MKMIAFSLLLSVSSVQCCFAQLSYNKSSDSIGSHKIIVDETNGLLSWYQPHLPGAAYDHVLRLAAEFIRSGVPIDPATGLKLYLIACGFDGPHMNSSSAFKAGRTWSGWMHNPACLYAGMVQSLAVGYRVYSGDSSYLDIVRSMLNYQLTHGTTGSEYDWARVPFASSDGGDTVYRGGIRYSSDGKGDGLDGTEPDKVAELGTGYLHFYEISNESRYLDAALDCAKALCSHIRDTRPADSTLSIGNTASSPWPFRVNARTGKVSSEYCSNVIEPIRLLEELLRIAPVIHLSAGDIALYRRTRNIAWDWLFSKNGPLKTFIWNGYFEDIPNDTNRSNRVQITPLETARYLLEQHSNDPDVLRNVPLLIDWVKVVFGDRHWPAINEQTWCYEPMASHTARYASVAAEWYAYSGQLKYKDDAFRYFNYATYLTDTNGIVRVGPNWPGSWFSDGYSDYIRHFIAGMAAVPEWAPAGGNHLLKSSSTVRSIQYSAGEISYVTFEDSATDVLRLTAQPAKVTSGRQALPQLFSKTGRPPATMNQLVREGWSWEPLRKGGILRINHRDHGNILILLGR